MRHSLRLQLLAGLLGPLAVVLFVLVSIAHRTAVQTAQTVTDRMLVGSARTIAEQISFGTNGLEAVIPPAALSIFDFGTYDEVYYRVTDDRGRLLAGYGDLLPDAVGSDIQPRFVDAMFSAQPLRATIVKQLVPSPNGLRSVTVVVAETLNDREAMTRSLWIGNAVPEALLVVMSAALASLVLRRGLAPLLRFSNDVAERRFDEFEPFQAAGVQRELRPVVDALNGYMRRLRAQVEAQRRFTANAAHQLRTPLTLLRTQASFAIRGEGEAERREASQAIVATTRRMARLINQLLNLARVEPDGHRVALEATDIAALVRGVLEEYGALAVARDVDLAFEDASDGGDCRARVDPAMLRDLIVNVVDNAIRATSAGGTVDVAVRAEDDACIVAVEDSGPGIPAEERERVFERFYRLHTNDGEGSGLGLAIVREIAASHDGTIVLGDRRDGRSGLVLTLRLPRARVAFAANA